MIKAGRKPKIQLKIAIDCGALSPSDNREMGGIATITVNLLDQLGSIDKRNLYLLYSFKPLPVSVLIKFDQRVINRVLPKQGFNKIWMRGALKWDKPDVFLALSQAGANKNISTLGFIYDLAFLKYSNFHKNSIKLKANTLELVKFANKIVTISKTSKQEIVNQLKVEEDKIEVIYPGVNPVFTPQGAKFIDSNPYFLFVGTLKQSKNILKIIQGFSQFITRSRQKYKLVFIGNDKEINNGLKSLIKNDNLEKYIEFKGWVKQTDLVKYYRGAVGFVSPSLVEGFGLPWVEAIACGTPVIASRTAIAEEILGNSAVLVDSDSVIGICQALLLLAEDEKVRRKLIIRGINQARKYSWIKFARGVLKNIDQIISVHI